MQMMRNVDREKVVQELRIGRWDGRGCVDRVFIGPHVIVA